MSESPRLPPDSSTSSSSSSSTSSRNLSPSEGPITLADESTFLHLSELLQVHLTRSDVTRQSFQTQNQSPGESGTTSLGRETEPAQHVATGLPSSSSSSSPLHSSSRQEAGPADSPSSTPSDPSASGLSASDPPASAVRPASAYRPAVRRQRLEQDSGPPSASGLSTTPSDLPSASGLSTTPSDLPSASGLSTTPSDLPSASGLSTTPSDLPSTSGPLSTSASGLSSGLNHCQFMGESITSASSPVQPNQPVIISTRVPEFSVIGPFDGSGTKSAAR
ncbi:hypothetical protein GGR56DRAFT_624498 [Xylariaceae sp. FL0804]|nr:hypothetical protein GGR56DRAFT_624498 [Xylariaceae sp. FL0804]